ncbi:MAG: hypothetical protein JW908_08390 [Anaerolineales bacterium]|nr:hypothetical protein [Anaerolineales bacterium]
MNISGPAPIATVQRPDESTLALRLNQRFAAEVLQVSGDRAILSVEGVQIVARMTSMEQASQLIERRFAQFVVRDLSESSVTIQLLSQGKSTGQLASTQAPEFIPNLLKFAGLPVNETTEMIARALLSNQLPVTVELVTEMHTLLMQEAHWDQNTAQLAAALKAAGIPLSLGALALAKSDFPALVEMVTSLQTKLETIQQSNVPAITKELAKNAIELLRQLVVSLGDKSEPLKTNLQDVFRILGTPIEKELAKFVIKGEQNPVLDATGKSLMTLAVLRRYLSTNPSQRGLVNEIDRFLEAARFLQLLNSSTLTEPNQESWLRMDIPLSIAHPGIRAQERQKDLSSAHLRISYSPENEEKRIDPANTHFVVNVDLDEKESIQINVSIAEKRVGMEVFTTTDKTRNLAEEELPGLKEGIETLGYIVQSVECETAKIENESSLGASSIWRSFGEVSVEV